MIPRSHHSTAFLVLAGAALSSGMAFADPPPDGRTDHGRGSIFLVTDLTETTRARSQSAVEPDAPAGSTLQTVAPATEELAQTRREPFREVRDAPFKVINHPLDPAPVL